MLTSATEGFNDSRMWRVHAAGVNLVHMSRKCYAQNVHVGRVYHANVHVGRVHHANVHVGRVYHANVHVGRVYHANVHVGRVYHANARNKGCYFWTPLYIYIWLDFITKQGRSRTIFS
jgi:hypothetical protein